MNMLSLLRHYPIIRAAFSAAVAGVAVSITARFWLPYRPVLERITIPLPPGHEELAGLRLGFITDTHLGPFVSPAHVEHAVAMLAAAAPDLVLFGGDYISESPRFIRRATAALGRLAAAAPLGGVAVLGNHDISTDQVKMRIALEQAGIRVLRNKSVPITTAHGSLWIAGVDETILGAADLDATFAEIPPSSAILALWHEPDYADQTAARGAFAQLSGHSHGGQVRLPGIGPMVLPPGGRKYPAGMYQIGGMTLYTARGVGVYRPPVRLFCPPEVTLITLTASNAQ